MAELRPLSLGALARRMLRELREHDACFDLPRRKFFLGTADVDLSVDFHGHSAATPLGPAAGPHSQMAQNLVLSFLGGCRIMELKTVQIKDELEIPRPCIDMQTVGYNVEWSQELKLEQSLLEYVKGSMLLEILQHSGQVTLPAGYERFLFDMSVGYDLAGIKTDRVQAFIRGMKDCTAQVDALRGELTGELAKYRDLDFNTALSSSLTLSTFHGCPPDEIEKIIEYLLDENALHCVVKLNPMLLGKTRARELLGGVMAYDDIHIPDTAFERDASWQQAQGFVTRLGDRAEKLGLGFGVKFSNTLIVENRRDFFPKEEKEMYLSGPPLFVLAMNLVRQFRAEFGDKYPISFSAGIDRENFADAVALGLVPVTVCSDLLKPGGYARATKYVDDLAARMKKVGAPDISEWIVRAHGQGRAALDAVGLASDDPKRNACEAALDSGGNLREAAGDELLAKWTSHARLLNTEQFVPKATEDPRYAKVKNNKPPRKVGTSLELFDCLTCDKCIPVCPNDANFSFVLPKLELGILKVQKLEVQKDGQWWKSREDGQITLAKKAQYGNFADFCNECGNCDVFCPEDGGPYLVKPRFFGSLEDFREFSTHDGFYLDREADGTIFGRFGGREYSRRSGEGKTVVYCGEGFELTFNPDEPLETLTGTADGEVDLSYCHILGWLCDAVYASGAMNYLTA